MVQKSGVHQFQSVDSPIIYGAVLYTIQPLSVVGWEWDDSKKHQQQKLDHSPVPAEGYYNYLLPNKHLTSSAPDFLRIWPTWDQDPNFWDNRITLPSLPSFSFFEDDESHHGGWNTHWGWGMKLVQWKKRWKSYRNPQKCWSQTDRLSKNQQTVL